MHIFCLDYTVSVSKSYPLRVQNKLTTSVYGNIADALNDDNRKCVEYIFEAMKELDIEPKDIAMRGGTDGSFISTKGIPTPNYFTGALNFHSNCEFMPMAAVEKSCLMTLKLVELITK